MSPAPPDPRTDGHPKVVDIASRAPEAGQDNLGGLLAAVRDLTLTQASALVSGLLDNVDDTLFDLAEKAESNATQTEYFDGMREARKRRPRIERLFRERVARGFADFATGRPVRESDAQKAFSASGELSLVDDRELEESLAVSSMVSKADGRLASALGALNQRLSVLSGGRTTSNASNPLAPAALTEAFREALAELAELNIRVRLIILKMFERYVLKLLDKIYDDVNAQLVKAGVLPQLRRPPAAQRPASAPTSGNAERRRAPAHGAAPAPAAGDFDDDVGSYEVHAELMQRVASLLAARRQPGGSGVGAGSGAYYSGGGGGVSPGVASLSPAELLGALSLLQGAADPPPAAPEVADTHLALGAVQHLKSELLLQIGRLSGQTKVHVSGSDEDTIDLVGMLFEYILQDNTVPAPMQVLLARLQIPYLKVAILDRRMFAHASHPARKLLDKLADTAKGWSEESDRDRRLFDKVRGIVETLLQDFDDDIGVFERQLEEFSQFVEHNRKRAELAEGRAAEAARGRERLQEARRIAAREILTRIRNRELPDLFRDLLIRPWANYLVLIALRQGHDSPEFRAALRFMDDFVATAEPPHGEPARASYRGALASLERNLREGLTVVAFQKPDADRLLAQLWRYWRQQLGELAPAATEPSPATAPAFGTGDAAQPIVTDEIAAETAEDPRESTHGIDPEVVRLVRELKVGVWVEFRDASGTRERAKLSWRSPISGKYLFVNRRGLKVADRTVAQLATELVHGQASVLEEVPLFDRALDAIVARLRDAQTARPQRPTPKA